jgi:hypothetical protein
MNLMKAFAHAPLLVGREGGSTRWLSFSASLFLVLKWGPKIRF